MNTFSYQPSEGISCECRKNWYIALKMSTLAIMIGSKPTKGIHSQKMGLYSVMNHPLRMDTVRLKVRAEWCGRWAAQSRRMLWLSRWCQ